MFRRFRAQGFRNLEDLELDDLARVNLIAGGNGTGKTALLEALFLHCAQNPSLVLKLRAFRGYGDTVALSLTKREDTPWQSLFARFDETHGIELESRDGKQERRIQRICAVSDLDELRAIPGLQKGLPTEFSDSSVPFPRVLKLEQEKQNHIDSTYLIADAESVRMDPAVPRPAPFPAHFLRTRRPVVLRELAQRFGKLEKAGEQEKLVRMLKVIEPRLLRVATVVVGEDAILHGDIGLGYLVPLLEMGDGVSRLAEVALTIREAAGGVVLVDEVENGIHHSALENVWRALRQAAREQDVQLFATTHSFECITAAHRAFSEGDDYDLKLIRLERVKEKTRAVAYDQEMLEAAMETDMEVR
ncbi:MAG: AAA family ATPase [Planctomycetota bacterium]